MIKIANKDVKVEAKVKLVFEGTDKEFSGEAEKVKFGKEIKAGLGDKKELTEERLRRVIASAVKHLAAQEIKTALFDIKGLNTRAAVEGAAFANYVFNKYKSKKENGFLEKIYFKNVDVKEFKKTVIVCNAVNFARDLGNEPAGTIYPETFAKAARSLKNVEVWDKKRLEKEKFYGTLTVGMGSDKSPKAVIIKHLKGKGKPVVLVGKGVTFDSGGYDLKSAKGMINMKTDMCGGAAVLATLKAVQELDLKVNLIGIVPLAENLVNGKAFKPGDVIKAMNGVTVEVGNTDAEGRLLLMDGLCYAEKLKPKVTIDLATLTGAVKYALGSIYSGAFTEKDDLWDAMNKAGNKSGDKIWRLPCESDYDRYIKGEIADWSNSGRGTAGSVTASRFLEKFAPENWIHLDIAGAARIDEDFEYFRKGTSGAGVRLLVEYLSNF